MVYDDDIDYLSFIYYLCRYLFMSKLVYVYIFYIYVCICVYGYQLFIIICVYISNVYIYLLYMSGDWWGVKDSLKDQ